jgi:membrane-bound serine protease (ClpP class)
LGSLGLILELYNPGSIFPGVAGGISILLAFYALGTLPVNYAGLALLAFGLLLAALEPFVASHGILGGGGAVAFLLGSLLLINVPNTAPYLAVSPLAIGATTAVLALFSILALGAILRGRRRKVVTGREGLIGARAIVRQPLDATQPGAVLVHGEIWRALATSGSLQPGDAAAVEGIDGLVLRVRSTPERPVSH